MTKYEIAFKGEILMEKGAGVLADMFWYSKKNPGSDSYILPLEQMVWSAKQDILGAKTELDLAEIKGKFDFASGFLSALEERQHV